MLSELNCLHLPPEKIVNMKREELMREFEEIRLEGAARQGNPGLAVRLRMWVAKLFGAGERARQRALAPRQSHIDSAIRLAA